VLPTLGSLKKRKEKNAIICYGRHRYGEAPPSKATDLFIRKPRLPTCFQAKALDKFIFGAAANQFQSAKLFSGGRPAKRKTIL
jgi:hypothetical protein